MKELNTVKKNLNQKIDGTSEFPTRVAPEQPHKQSWLNQLVPSLLLQINGKNKMSLYLMKSNAMEMYGRVEEEFRQS